MNEDIGAILSDFRARRWEAQPHEKLIALLDSQPDRAPQVVHHIIREMRSGPTFLDFAVHKLPEAAFAELVEAALASLREDEHNEGALEFLAHASLQAPEALHPHLPEIFRLRPNWDSYYAQWPWRESGNSQLPFLREMANSDSAAVSAMLETRHPDALRDARAEDLLQVGFAGPPIRQLYSQASYHLCYPPDHFCDDDTPTHLKKRHPTWKLGDGPYPPMRFGGEGAGPCHICGGRLHHILTLNPVPPGLGITGVESLVLETCLSCLGWEVGAERLYYQHAATGAPSPVGDGPGDLTPQFPAQPLRQAQIRLVPTPRRWWWQDWALSNSRENLNRAGGHPAWIQDADYLSCPTCGMHMTHLLQLDSNLTAEDEGEWLWGSGGLCYVGWCDACKISGFQWQCT